MELQSIVVFVAFLLQSVHEVAGGVTRFNTGAFCCVVPMPTSGYTYMYEERINSGGIFKCVDWLILMDDVPTKYFFGETSLLWPTELLCSVTILVRDSVLMARDGNLGGAITFHFFAIVNFVCVANEPTTAEPMLLHWLPGCLPAW